MKKYRPHESHVDHPNVVPLVDIFLCLIVFYMLVARIGVVTGADKEINVVTTRLGQKLTLSNSLILNVKELNNSPSISALIPGDSQVENIPIAQLDDVLKGLRNGRDGRRGTADDATGLKLIIRADQTINYRTFMPVMLAIQDSGIDDIFHNTREPE